MIFGIPWWVYLVLAVVLYVMYLLVMVDAPPPNNTTTTPVNASRSFWEELKLKAKKKLGLDE